MDIKQSFLNAARNLYANKRRSIQAMFALIVAVAAFIVLGNTCQVLIQQVETSWTPDIMSNNNIYISSRVDSNKRATIEDLEKIAEANPDIILGVSPYIVADSIYCNVRYGDKIYKKGNYFGVNEQYADMHCVKLKEGRFIQYMDCRREQNVCVVGTDIADKLLGGDALGKTLNIDGYNFTVVGVDDDNTAGLIFLPYTCARKMVGDVIRTGYQENKYYADRFEVKANGMENIGNVRNLIQEEIDKLLGKDNWSMTFLSYQFVKEDVIGYAVSQVYKYFLLALLVLLLGGVGVMNVMIASVEVRTKEIGIRKAFGATNKNIHWQFRLEALITSLFGGFLGLVFGVMLSFAAPWLLDFSVFGFPVSELDIHITAWPILLALGLSVSVGVIFGTYPAQQAAKLEPVAAINES